MPYLDPFLSTTGVPDAPLGRLIRALSLLPGVGVKTAQRMAFHLLQHERSGALELSQALSAALTQVRHCERCYTFTEQPLCALCCSASRDARLLCVVETPADQATLERSACYTGLYFVLMGRLSPLDGVGPKEIGWGALLARACEQEVGEVIVATNFTAEGEATAFALTQELQARGRKVTRLARGVPAGSELEYVDLSTLAHAFAKRS